LDHDAPRLEFMMSRPELTSMWVDDKRFLRSLGRQREERGDALGDTGVSP
jgi:hypothetical protein